MGSLQTELQRLYFPLPDSLQGDDSQPWRTIDPHGRVRAMVMEVQSPPGWDALSRVWQGVQAEFELPAPAIAVSGSDGLQLWFSLAEPVFAAQAHAFLDRLRQRFMGELDLRRVRLLPTPDAASSPAERQMLPAPALQDNGNWSAFLAPDLVPIFADTPWLDTPPSEEGQASLLRAIQVMKPSAFGAACEALGLAAASSTPDAQAAASLDARLAGPTLDAAAERPEAAIPAEVSGSTEPSSPADARAQARRFLLHVMRDPTVTLAHRIDAARALLQDSASRP